MTTGSELVTVADAADAWFVQPATVRRWCAAGRLRAVRIGKGWRITRAEIARVSRQGLRS